MTLFKLKSFFIIGSFLFTTNVFAAYCFTLSKSITSCNPQEIQSKLTAKDGVAVVRNFEGSDKVQNFIIHSDSNQYITDKISKETYSFKRSGGKYEMTYLTGCVEKGLISETKDKVIFTVQSLGESCENAKKMREVMKQMFPKDNPDRFEWRKIQY
jgi:hypothetical protein